MELSGIPEEFRDRIADEGKTANFDELGWSELPDWLGDLTGITTLNLTGNEATSSCSTATRHALRRH